MECKNITLSIIVPVYNVEGYIEECIQSFYSKCNADCIQVIIVDDGSTDNSRAICDRLSQNRNIEVYHKKNGGLASARNFGLKKAVGKYIAFVDSDDIISGDRFKEVLKELDRCNADVVFMNTMKLYPDGTKKDMGENIKKIKLLDCNKNKVLKYLASRKKFPASAWGKIYKKEFLDKNNLSFPKKNIVSEDLGFSFDAIRLAESYYKIDEPYYLYRQNRKGSITNDYSKKSFDGVYEFVSKYADMYTCNCSKNNSTPLTSFVAYEYLILIMLLSYVEPNYEKECINKLIKYKKVLRYGRTFRIIVIRFIIEVIGIRKTSALLKKLKGGTGK